METVICYGTLRQGFYNHHYLHSSIFIGKGTLIKPATMFEAYGGSFPILSISSSSIHTIVVELYEVNSETLARLDSLEGYPKWYTRTQEEIKLENGTIRKGWIYHQDNHEDLMIVESGDWAVDYLKSFHASLAT